MTHIPPRWNDVPDWQRIVAGALNPALNGFPFPQFATAPTGVSDGFTYFDTALGKVRTWAGGAWNNHF